MSAFVKIVSFLADLVQVIAGGIALYIGFTKREKISAAFRILYNFSLQTSLAELKHWLLKLEESKINSKDNSKDVRVSLAYIVGKIKGNRILYAHFGEKMLKRLNVIIADLEEGRSVTDSNRISLYSEIRESLATLEIDNHQIKSQKNE